MSTIQFFGVMTLLAVLTVKADPKEALEITVLSQGLVWADHWWRNR